MLENIVKQEIIFYVMGMLLIFGVLAKLISAFTVRRVAKSAGEIQKSNQKLMRLIKAKFEHASMISDKVQNVGVFVDKYIYEYKVFGVRLHGWRTLPKKIMWIIGILGVFATFESYRLWGVGDLMVEYAQWTGVFVMILLLFYFIGEENLRLQAAKNYIVDYLENVCVHRYEKMNKAAEKTEEAAKIPEEPEASEETGEEMKQNMEGEDSEEAIAQIAEQLEEGRKKSEQEIRIRAILEEFLT